MLKEDSLKEKNTYSSQLLLSYRVALCLILNVSMHTHPAQIP